MMSLMSVLAFRKEYALRVTPLSATCRGHLVPANKQAGPRLHLQQVLVPGAIRVPGRISSNPYHHPEGGRLKELRWLPQGHTASEWWTQCLNSVISMPKSTVNIQMPPPPTNPVLV
jgi:hypothetical protein